MARPGTCNELFYRYRLLLLVVVLTAGCAHRTPVLPVDISGTSAPPQIELTDTPFISQQRYQCGPAALAMVLQQSGVAVAADDLVPQVYLPERKGSLQIEMVAASRRYNRVPYLIEPTVAALVKALESGYPVLVLQNLGLQARPLWHYAVVIGYARDSDAVILRSGTDERQRMPAWLFLKTWQSAGNWGMVALRPDQLPQFAERRRYLDAITSMEGVAEPDAVLQAYQSALDRWPDDVIARFGLASSLQQQRRLAEAADTYRWILATQPDHVAAMNNLAHVYADLDCYSSADTTIRTALDLSGEEDPLFPALMDTFRRIQRGRALSADNCSGQRYGSFTAELIRVCNAPDPC